MPTLAQSLSPDTLTRRFPPLLSNVLPTRLARARETIPSVTASDASRATTTRLRDPRADQPILNDLLNFIAHNSRKSPKSGHAVCSACSLPPFPLNACSASTTASQLNRGGTLFRRREPGQHAAAAAKQRATAQSVLARPHASCRSQARSIHSSARLSH